MRAFCRSNHVLGFDTMRGSVTHSSPPTEVTDHYFCQALVLDFYWQLDQRDYQAMRGLMHDDGEWHRQGKVLTRDTLIPELSKRPLTLLTHHLLSNFQSAAIQPGVRKAVGYLTVYRHDDGVPIDGPAPLGTAAVIQSWRGEFREDVEGWRISLIAGTRTWAAV